MAADGSFVVRVDADTKKAQAELNRLVKKIDELNAKVAQDTGAKMPIEESARSLGAALDEAKAKLYEMQEAGIGEYRTDEIEHQKETVTALQAQWEGATKEVERYDKSIAKSTKKIELAEQKAGQLSVNLQDAGASGEEAGTRAATGFEKLERRIIGLAKRVFIFSVITMALRGLRTWLTNALQTNEQFSEAWARLKGALLTAAQPILQVLIPALTTLINILTRVIMVIARFFAMLSGQSVSDTAAQAEALNNEQKAIKGVGGAAKKASKQLAAFDEINQLSSPDAGGGGGGGADTGKQPDFSWINDAQDGLDRILTIVLMIGTAVAAMKLAEKFGAGGTVALGIAAIAAGLFLIIDGFHKAFEEGLNWENTLEIIGGLLAAGLGIAILTGSWIPLLIAGVAGALMALVMFTGHGEELIEGLKETFGGFIEFFTGIFTGDMEKAVEGLKHIWSGLKKTWNAIIASIKDGWRMFVEWFNGITNGEFAGVLQNIENLFSGLYDAISRILKGVIDFIAGVFTGDWERAWKGIVDIFAGVVNALFSGFEFIVNGVIEALNWLIRQANKISFKDPLTGATIGVNIKEIEWRLAIPRIPALAAGAVIPPNREFMAVLGDQKSGTNIEAPLDTIVAAFRQAMNENGGGKQTIVLQLDRRELGRAVVDVYGMESQRVGLKLGGAY